MTIQEYNTKVWPFYLRLEKEFLNTLNYVEFTEDNFDTYSIEFEKLLLSIGLRLMYYVSFCVKRSNQTNRQIIFASMQIFYADMRSLHLRM